MLSVALRLHDKKCRGREWSRIREVHLSSSSVGGESDKTGVPAVAELSNESIVQAMKEGAKYAAENPGDDSGLSPSSTSSSSGSELSDRVQNVFLREPSSHSLEPHSVAPSRAANKDSRPRITSRTENQVPVERPPQVTFSVLNPKASWRSWKSARLAPFLQKVDQTRQFVQRMRQRWPMIRMLLIVSGITTLGVITWMSVRSAVDTLHQWQQQAQDTRRKVEDIFADVHRRWDGSSERAAQLRDRFWKNVDNMKETVQTTTTEVMSQSSARIEQAQQRLDDVMDNTQDTVAERWGDAQQQMTANVDQWRQSYTEHLDKLMKSQGYEKDDENTNTMREDNSQEQKR